MHRMQEGLLPEGAKGVRTTKDVQLLQSRILDTFLTQYISVCCVIRCLL